MARALLNDGTFEVRAVTRSPAKKEAQELKQKGAEVVKADQDDEASLEVALAGAHGAFIVTNFWEHRSKEKEIAQVPVPTLSGTTCRMAGRREQGAAVWHRCGGHGTALSVAWPALIVQVAHPEKS